MTCAVLVAEMVAVLRQHPDGVLLRRSLPAEHVRMATAWLVYSVVLMIVAVTVLLAMETGARFGIVMPQLRGTRCATRGHRVGQTDLRMRPPPELPALPPSATDPRIGMVGVGCAALYLVLLVRNPSLTPLMALAGLLAAYALPVLLLEILVRRVHRAPTTGLDWSRPPAPSCARVVLKLIGLIASVASVFAVHALFRFYASEDLAIPLALFVWLAPGLVVLVPAYVWWVDARQADPQDDYWRLGAILTGRLPLAEAAALRDLALGWAIKGFFLPNMLAYLYHNLGGLHHLKAALSGDMVQLVFGLTLIALMLELAIVCTGYALTLRALDAHIRTPNPYLAAWVVTLAVYEPFNRIITGQVFRYRTETGWVEMVWQNPALTVPWLTVILASYALWVWATAAFGLRWSNLTHRGIITNGPYRWTKHPDYVSKITFFWFGAAPFLTAATPWAAVAGTAALVVVTGIYWGRARMEERHLSQDPVYVAYALAMNERSLFAPLARRWPWLAYVPPADARPDPAHPSDKPRILRRGTIVTVRPAE